MTVDKTVILSNYRYCGVTFFYNNFTNVNTQILKNLKISIELFSYVYFQFLDGRVGLDHFGITRSNV